MNAERKDKIIPIRVSNEAKLRLIEAARRRGQTLSEFLRRSAEEAKLKGEAA